MSADGQLRLFGADAPDVQLSRVWAMPSHNTFSVAPIAAFVKRHIRHGFVSVDPFARNSKTATYRNDLSPDTAAEYHMDAVDFCAHLKAEGVQADAVLFDPPYSPRQITEVYQSIGLQASMKDTQTAVLYQRVRDGLDAILKPGGVSLSFGWNSAGMGKARGYEALEILLVAHGGAHNDTICVAERKAAHG